MNAHDIQNPLALGLTIGAALLAGLLAVTHLRNGPSGIDPQSRFPRWREAMSLFLLTVTWVLFAPAAVVSKWTGHPLEFLFGPEVGDGGLIELVTVCCWLGASALFATLAVRRRSLESVLWTLAAAAAFVIAGEELSWGQWLFGWSTPETWAQINAQKETNLHNLASPDQFELAYALVGGALLAGSAMVVGFESLGRWPLVGPWIRIVRGDRWTILLALSAAPLLQSHLFQEIAELVLAATAFSAAAAFLAGTNPAPRRT